MGRLLVSMAVSIDGYAAGPDQSQENPLGIGGRTLHNWFFPTKTFQAMIGKGPGEEGIDEDFAVRYSKGLGATIMGRNMFGPIRGPWPDDNWKGWWGPNPPYHTPVFVLTHYARPPLPMEGGTTFHFVTDGIRSALKKAQDAAQGKDIRIGGGVAVVREYLKEGLADEIHLAVSPVLLGSGENLLAGLNLPRLGYQCSENIPSKLATHMVLTRKK